VEKREPVGLAVIDYAAIVAAIDDAAVIGLMRDALVAQSRGQCETPMPMHLEVAPESAEVHVKSSYRAGGPFFVLKVASTFPRNAARGLSTGSGIMLLVSAHTGEPAAVLADNGHLTDVRTAAVTAMVTRELGRRDAVLGIIGTGIQARLQARFHRAVLPLEAVVVWGRDPVRAAACARDIEAEAADAGRLVRTTVAASPGEVASRARVIVTCTMSRAPLLEVAHLQPGTLVNAVGADGQGKQELDPGILGAASLLLVDSLAQCARLGELQHAPDQQDRAIEIGAYVDRPDRPPSGDLVVSDFTGLGVEDLYIAEHVFRNVHEAGPDHQADA
jgi:ornithine cyclodeaminase